MCYTHNDTSQFPGVDEIRLMISRKVVSGHVVSTIYLEIRFYFNPESVSHVNKHTHLYTLSMLMAIY